MQGYTNCKLSSQKRKKKMINVWRDTHGDTSQTSHRSGRNYMESTVNKDSQEMFQCVENLL